MDATVVWKKGLSFTGTGGTTSFSLPIGADPKVGGENDGFRPTEFLGDQRALGRRARVAPQLRGSQHIARGVERNEAMLLPRYADGRDPCPKCRSQHRETRPDAVDPPLGQLLPAAVVGSDQPQWPPVRGNDLV